ncbi:Rha family transcriptional regulator [Pelagibacterium sp.]|uniref:Rha family transcriptional regulator n=1 Tax=Pelagibacterium sp. TaxID=1967288 RepID=UPI003A8F12A7
MTSTSLTQPVVTSMRGKETTNSRHVAALFGKRHADVLRAIDGVECSVPFNERNFASVDYRDGKGEMRRSVDMTKDGFVFLVRGFTGKEAAQRVRRGCFGCASPYSASAIAAEIPRRSNWFLGDASFTKPMMSSVASSISK